MVKTFLLIVCVVYSALIEGAKGSPCSAENRKKALGTCLKNITDSFVDDNLWWFGSSFADRCPLGDPINITCYRNHRFNGLSLASTFYPGGSFKAETVTKYLDVRFKSEKGEYTGCGHLTKISTNRMLEVDPSARDVIIDPWDARDMPEVTWKADTGKRYTLLIQDGSNGALNGLIVNIAGNGVSTGNVIVPYHGPVTFRNITDPFVFLLFEQEVQNITVSDITRTANRFNTTGLVNAYGLKGPIGLTWASIGYDLYSAEKSRKAGWIENCSPFVTKALRDESLPFIPDTAVTKPLPGFVSVNITTTDHLKFTYCCQKYSLPPATIRVDPFLSTPLSPAVVRTGATVSVYLTPNKIQPNSTDDHKGQLFTVVHVDPDIPAASSTVGTRDRPNLHQLVTNLRVTGADGLMTGGTEVQSYRGPMPPPIEPRVHGYYFLVYKQQGALTVNSSHYSGKQCAERLRGRCLFNVTAFTMSNNMSLYAATWMKAENDDYVNYVRQLNQTTTCQGRPGFSTPCTAATTKAPSPTPSASNELGPPLMTLVLLGYAFILGIY